MSQQWTTPEEAPQVPLGTGAAEPSEEAYSESKPRVNNATLALVASFAAALLVIYLVGLQNRPRTANADQVQREQQVQSAIAELLEKNGKAEQIKSLFADTKRLVPMFYNYLGAPEGKPPELPADPFAPQDGNRTSSLTPLDPVRVEPINTAEADALRKVAETFSALKLQSVMLSKTNSAAMINNRMVSVGNKLGDLVVTDIEANRVLLAFGAHKFELKLTRPNMDKDR
jgi:hypothetical protein